MSENLNVLVAAFAIVVFTRISEFPQAGGQSMPGTGTQIVIPSRHVSGTRATFDLTSTFTIVQIQGKSTSNSGAGGLGPFGDSSYLAVVVDSDNYRKGESISLIAQGTISNHSELLTGQRYLVSVPAGPGDTQQSQTGVSDSGSKLRGGSSEGAWSVNFVVPTGATTLRREGTPRQRLNAELLDALQSARGIGALQVAHALWNYRAFDRGTNNLPPGTTLQAALLAVSHVHDGSDDPLVHLATSILVQGVGVDGSEVQFERAVVEVANRAGPDDAFDNGLLSFLNGNSKLFRPREGSSPLAGGNDRASMFDAVIACQSSSLQDALLPSLISKGSLNQAQCIALAARLFQPDPRSAKDSQSWNRHLMVLIHALQTNTYGDF